MPRSGSRERETVGETPRPSPTAATDGSIDFTRRHLLYLLGFTILATGLRLCGLGEWSLWVDEAHTLRDATVPMEQWLSVPGATNSYPLSFLVLRLLAAVFDLGPGELSEWFLRVPFAVFGILSVPTLAWVARPMVGRKAALLAALFLAVSPWHIYWSQNARAYAMMTFFGLIAIGAMDRGRTRRAAWPMVLAALFLVIAGLCHPTAYQLAFAILAYLLGGVIREHQRARKFGRWAPLVLLGVLALLTPLMLDVVQRFVAGKQPEFSLFHLGQTLAFFVGLPILVAALAGLLLLFDRGRPAAYLASLLVLPLIGLAMAAASGLFPKLSAQYSFAVLPTIYILAAAAVMHMVQSFRGVGPRPVMLRLLAIGVFVGPMLGQDYLYFTQEFGWRPRWTEAMAIVQATATELEQNAITVLTTNEPSMTYYAERDRLAGNELDVQLAPLTRWQIRANEQHPNRTPESYIQDVAARATTAGRGFFVVVSEAVLDEQDLDGRARAFLQRNFTPIHRLPAWTGPKDMILTIYRQSDPAKTAPPDQGR